jgi:hypothetical protein
VTENVGTPISLEISGIAIFTIVPSTITMEKIPSVKTTTHFLITQPSKLLYFNLNACACTYLTGFTFFSDKSKIV